MFNECVYVIKNAIDKFLPGFYGSHKVNLQKVLYSNHIIIFEKSLFGVCMYNKRVVRVLSGIKRSAIASCLDKTLLLVYYTVHKLNNINSLHTS